MGAQGPARLAIALVAVLALSSPAMACRLEKEPTQVVFFDVPAGLPSDLSVLEVEFEDKGPPTETWSPWAPRPARVKKVVRGSNPGPFVSVVMATEVMGSCDWIPTRGKSGLIIGRWSPGGLASYPEFVPIHETIAQRLARKGLHRPSPTDRVGG